MTASQDQKSESELKSESGWTSGVSLGRLGAAAFVLGLVLGLGGIVRDCALTCHVGYRHAPIAFLVVAALSLPIMALQLRMQRRWGAETWRVRSTVFVVAVLFAFRLLLLALHSESGSVGELARVLYVAFFVWVDVAFMLIGAQLFALVQGDERATDRGLTVFSAAVYAGGLIGGLVAAGANSWLTERLHLPFDIARDHLMLAMAIVLLLLLPIARSESPAPAAPAPAPDRAEAAAAEDQGGMKMALRVLAGEPESRVVTAAFVFASASGICLESLFYWILTLQSAGGGGFVRLLATLSIWMNGASLVLAAGGASRIIRHVGLAAAVLAVPACLLLGSGYLLVATGLLVMLAMRVLKDSLSGGLYEPASERLLVRLQGERYSKQRPIFEVASRLGTGLGALLVLLLTLGLNASVNALIVLVVALHVLWLVVLVPLARRSRQAAAAS